MSQQDERWYEEGLAFSCTQCGKCCTNHGDYSYVYVSKTDVTNISTHLGLTKRAFRKEYTIKDGALTSLRIDSKACPFLGEDKRCKIYEVRPKQCATWPFWEENLVQATWEGPVKDFCPGIDVGEKRSADEVKRIADETEEWYS